MRDFSVFAHIIVQSFGLNNISYLESFLSKFPEKKYQVKLPNDTHKRDANFVLEGCICRSHA